MRRFRIGKLPAAGVLALAALIGPASAAVVGPPEKPEDSRLADPVEVRSAAYAHLMRSVLAARRGEYRTAVGEIETAVQTEPGSSALRIEGAELLLWMGRKRDAEEMGRAALALAPDSPQALRFVADRLADRAFGSKDAEAERAEAIGLYRKILDLGEEDPDVLRLLTGLYLQEGNKTGALETARRLVTAKPGDRQATGLLAQLLMEQGRKEETLRFVLHYLARHPDDTALLRLAEDLANDLEAWVMVEEILSSSVDVGDRAVEAQRLRADALIHLNKIDEAIKAWERAMASDPGDRSVRYNLATAYRRMGRMADAAELARSLVEESPDDPRAQLLVAEIADGRGDNEGALLAFGTALRDLMLTGEIEALPLREAIRGEMILLHLGAGRVEEAQSVAAGFEQPAAAAALELEARIGLVAEDWSRTREAVRALRAAGEKGRADGIEAELFLRTKKWAKAAAKVEETIEALGPFARIRFAALYDEVGRPEQGEAILRRWIELDGGNADAWFHLGSFLYEQDSFDEAERALREAFRLDPTHARALNFLGYSLAERGERLDEALELVRRALDLDRWNGAYLDSLGWVYYQMGRFREARDPLEQAARDYPSDSTVLEHLGDLYDRVGEPELAVGAWTRALESASGDTDLLRAKIDRSLASSGRRPAEAPETGEPESVGERVDPDSPPRRP